MLGTPFLKPTRLSGRAGRPRSRLEEESALALLLRESPEVKRAQAGVERARAAVARARAEPIPDFYVRGAFGYSTEPLEASPVPRRTGPEGALEVGVRVPLFDRNQGQVAAARAELVAAEREVGRVDLVLRARLAAAFRNYRNARRVAGQYEREIIPRAQRAYDLYLASFRQMAAAYPQVLIAQRTLFQVRAEYVAALVEAWQSATQIQGFLLAGGLDAPPSLDARVRGGSEGGER